MHNLNSKFFKLLYLDDNVHSSPIILRGTKTMCWLLPRSAKWYDFVAKYTHITYITYHGYPLNLSDAVKLFLKILFGHYFCLDICCNGEQTQIVCIAKHGCSCRKQYAGPICNSMYQCWFCKLFFYQVLISLLQFKTYITWLLAGY